MGTFYADCAVINPSNRSYRAEVRKALVDTGSEHTWISQTTLLSLGVAPEKEERFTLANGQAVMRYVGFAVLEANGKRTVDEVVFAQPGDLELLGARTMSGLNLVIDPRGERLVDGGLILAA